MSNNSSSQSPKLIPAPARILRRLCEMLGLAATYFFAAKLALLLAIPPGYATAVWPAAGIAIAVLLIRGSQLWPGVVLGSFFADLPT